MEYQFTPYVTPLLAAGLMTSLVAGYAVTQRKLPWGIPFAVLMTSVTVWSVSYALELCSVDMAGKLFWTDIEYVGFVSTPVAWLVMVIELTGSSSYVTPRRLALLSIVPVLTLSLLLTNDFHGLMRQNVHLDQGGPIATIGKTYGVWFWVHIFYSYTLVALGAALLVRMLLRTSPLYHVQPLALLIGMSLPLAANIAHLLGFRPAAGMDLSPVGFGFGGALLAWGTLGHGMFDLVPVARDKVIEWMTDGVILLDARGRVASLNPAAERYLNLTSDQVVGREAIAVFQSWPDLATLFSGSEMARADLCLNEDTSPQYFEVFVSILKDLHGQPVGRTITLHDSTKRKMIETALQESQAGFRNTVDSLPLAIYETDLSGNLVFGNRAGVGLFGYEWADFEAGLNIFDLITPESREEAAWAVGGILAGEPSTLHEYTALRKDGTTFPVVISASRILREGKVVGIKGFVLDISLRKKAEQAVRDSEERYRTLAEAAQDIIFISDLHGTIQYVNSIAASQRGCSPADLIGESLASLLSWGSAEDQIHTLKKVADSGQTVYFEHKATLGTHEAWLYTCLAPFRNDRGEVESVFGVSRDITAMVKMREELRALSLVDELTGLHNRRGFLALARQQLKIAERNHERVSILAADLDGLKSINDTFGHSEGDRALVAAARILKGSCRESDVVARMGGDEFAILAVEASSTSADTLAQRILHAVDTYNASSSRPYDLSLSIGVVSDCSAIDCSIEELVAKSDHLMYQDKRTKIVRHDTP
jgi:diguanylate cyclase (GGDEF)-like protein/PAS domain S-box-containing protein